MARTIDGSCNNLLFKNWGQAGTLYAEGPEGRELYEAQRNFQSTEPTEVLYKDQDSLPDYDGPRGNARNISNKLCTRTDEEEENVVDEVNHSMFSNIFGQFVNHDLENNRMVNASSRDYFPLVSYALDPEDPSCAPVFIPPQEGYRCGPDSRMIGSVSRASGVEVQADGTHRVYNDNTAYLDLNTVYGSDDTVASKLRAGTHGKMAVSDSKDITIVNMMTQQPFTYTFENFLPLYEDIQVPINPQFIDNGEPNATPSNMVFSAGDDRVNENIGLTFFHNLFLREHNRIADELIDSNLVWKLLPNLFDDVIYEKARMINIAQYQKIVYEQFFKSSYGQHNYDKLGDYTGYNPFVETATSQLFAGAIFRYGHFSMRNYFALNECGEAMEFGQPAANQDKKMEVLGMGAQFPAFIQPAGQLAMSGGWGNIARGLINERTAPIAFATNSDIRNLRIPNVGFLDLISLDLVRARYNDLPNYQQVRKHHYGLDSVTNNIYGLPGCPRSLENNENQDDPLDCFLAISSDTEIAQQLKDVYRKVNLIDVLIGVTAEDKVGGTSFGRTTSNVVIDQFKRTRDGDRFFYQSTFLRGLLSHKERQNLETVTMGHILRRNLEDYTDAPDNPFVAPDNYREQLQSNCSA